MRECCNSTCYQRDDAGERQWLGNIHIENNSLTADNNNSNTTTPRRRRRRRRTEPGELSNRAVVLMGERERERERVSEEVEEEETLFFFQHRAQV